ncbi:DUF177 domain-containing protein [Sphingomonas sp. 28-63-12]|uniref:DUF177 domain-containing protein n=1 Tax=Sphingomonas sp. 28-63-12 TaxID=1970434 RepID=UPI000BD7320C|nr:MAG: hypothetical protein B7Y47_00780 [Sphingomonas sp. 28-63-12]
MTLPEFHRPERVEMIGEMERVIKVSANAGERAALAARFALIELVRLDGSFSVARGPSGIVAHGRVIADVVQACVVTGEKLAVRIDETVALCFVADADPAGAEIELSLDALDIIAFDGHAIDLGEAAAETMALALAPFPRSANAEAVLRDAGILREEDVRPVGALAGLKAKLEGKKP